MLSSDIEVTLPQKRQSEQTLISLTKDRLKLSDIHRLLNSIHTSSELPSWISVEVIPP